MNDVDRKVLTGVVGQMEWCKAVNWSVNALTIVATVLGVCVILLVLAANARFKKVETMQRQQEQVAQYLLMVSTSTVKWVIAPEPMNATVYVSRESLEGLVKVKEAAKK